MRSRVVLVIWYLLIGLFAGLAIGYLVARLQRRPDTSADGLAVQVAELKTQFAEVEKKREELEAVRKEQIEAVKAQELKTAEEKEKRLKEWMESTQEFFKEQGKSREELEKKRDAMMQDMNAQIASFTRTVTGTSTRGRSGESILAEALRTSIQAGIVKTNIETGNGPVEFAWDLENGRYVPIDSKFPDLLDAVEAYTESEDPKEQQKLKKTIASKLKSEIKRFQKYLNQEKTVEVGILVVPEIALNINPDLVSQAFQKQVFVCSYWNVIPIAYTLERHYRHLEDDGDLGRYRQLTATLFSLFDVVSEKVSKIDRGLKMITNAKEEIADQVHLAHREKSTTPNGDDSQ